MDMWLIKLRRSHTKFEIRLLAWKLNDKKIIYMQNIQILTEIK